MGLSDIVRKDKRVVLIAPTDDFAGNVNSLHYSTVVSPPLGILAIGSYLVQHGFPVELIDTQMDFGIGITRDAEKTVRDRVAKHIQRTSESIAWIGISQLSNSGTGIDLAETIHLAVPEIPVVLGGYFPSTNYETILQKYKFISAVVRGDGERAALQLSQNAADGNDLVTRMVPNLVWRDHGQILTNHLESVHLNDVPIMDFSLLQNPAQYPQITLVSSRGCPFRCNYCLESTMRQYNAYSADWLSRQLAHLEETTSTKSVGFFEPVFGIGTHRIESVCEVMRDRRFKYAIMSRVDAFTPEQVSTLAEAGVKSMYLGMESASPDTLVRMNKVSSIAKAEIYIQQAHTLISACFENDVTVIIGFMLAFPGDTIADFDRTTQFVEKVGLEHNRIYSGQDGPGLIPLAIPTKVYEGSRLASNLSEHFPEVRLHTETYMGEHAVVSSSEEVTAAVVRHYQDAIIAKTIHTQSAMINWRQNYMFSMAKLLDANPDIIDANGVAHIGSILSQSEYDYHTGVVLLQRA